MSEKMLWSQDHMRSVRASKIRDFMVHESFKHDGWEVKGWYNINEHFYFGWFSTVEVAQAFLENLHKQIED